MDGQQNFVHLIYGFVHGGLEESEDIATVYATLKPLPPHCAMVSSAALMPACHRVVGECESYHVKRGRCLLQEAHQTRLAEVLSSADSLLLWRQDVIGHGRLLQDVGGDVLGVKADQSEKRFASGSNNGLSLRLSLSAFIFLPLD